MESRIRQAHCANVLRDLVAEAGDASAPAEQRDKLQRIAAKYAWTLYFDIVETTGKSPVSPEMEARCGVPDDVTYFEQLSSIQEMLKALGTLGKPYGTT